MSFNAEGSCCWAMACLPQWQRYWNVEYLNEKKDHSWKISCQHLWQAWSAPAATKKLVISLNGSQQTMEANPGPLIPMGLTSVLLLKLIHFNVICIYLELPRNANSSRIKDPQKPLNRWEGCLNYRRLLLQVMIGFNLSFAVIEFSYYSRLNSHALLLKCTMHPRNDVLCFLLTWREVFFFPSMC